MWKIKLWKYRISIVYMNTVIYTCFWYYSTLETKWSYNVLNNTHFDLLNTTFSVKRDILDYAFRSIFILTQLYHWLHWLEFRIRIQVENVLIYIYNMLPAATPLQSTYRNVWLNSSRTLSACSVFVCTFIVVTVTYDIRKKFEATHVVVMVVVDSGKTSDSRR